MQERGEEGAGAAPDASTKEEPSIIADGTTTTNPVEPPAKRAKATATDESEAVKHGAKTEPETASKTETKEEDSALQNVLNDQEPTLPSDAAPSAVADESGAAAVDSTELRWEIRGGGGRGRGNRSQTKKRADLDPVVPVTDDGILGPVKVCFFFQLNRCMTSRVCNVLFCARQQQN